MPELEKFLVKCPCGASLETQGWSAYVNDRLKGFQILHQSCKDIAIKQLETLSVPTHGPAEKPWESFTEMRDVQMENLQGAPGWFQRVIMGSFRFMPHHTVISLTDQTANSLTLKLTWPLPLSSILIKDGHPGDVDRNPYPWGWQYRKDEEPRT